MGALLTALAVVFLAEVGDKSLLVALGFGARHRIAPVLLGMAIAYTATNLIAVTLGGVLGSQLPTRAIGIAAGAVFVLFGLKGAWELWGGGASDDELAEEGSSLTSSKGVALSVAGTVFLAELGDKTMLSSAALAAKNSPVLVFVGSTLGVFFAGVTGVLIGRALGARFPERLVRTASVLVFAAVGVLTIVSSWRSPG